MTFDPTAFPIAVDPTKQRMRGTTRHGNIYFDVPFISEIGGNLWQGGCQFGLTLPTFIEHVISLYPWERYTVNHELKSSLEVRMYDDALKSYDQVVRALADWVWECMIDGPTLVHCQAGLNRSSLVAAFTMIRHQDYEPDAAIKLLREKRSPAVLCNPDFEKWLRSHG